MPRAPVSRRDRPAKPTLSRGAVVAAARALLDAEGIEAVTMRRVAAALDTGPASLYVYVRDGEDLRAQLLDALLVPLTEPEAGADPGPAAPWRARLHALLAATVAVLMDNPALARAALATQPSGPGFLRLVDRLLGLLLEGGAESRAAAWGADALLLLATAQAAEKGSWREAPDADARFATLGYAVREADPAALPHVAALAPHLLTGGPERMAWGFDALLTGIVAADDVGPPGAAAPRPPP